MIESEKRIERLYVQVAELGETDIIDNNKILSLYLQKPIDNIEKIPNWQYLMEVYVKIWEEELKDLDHKYHYENPFEYGPDRFMAWSILTGLIEELTTKTKIDEKS